MGKSIKLDNVLSSKWAVPSLHQQYNLRKIEINYSVPQGSMHGPLLFNIYSNTIQEIIPNNLLGYADDHSLTESFKPGNTTVKENLDCKVNNIRNE